VVVARWEGVLPKDAPVLGGPMPPEDTRGAPLG
jgi:hypothetical protein